MGQKQEVGYIGRILLGQYSSEELLT